MLEFVGSYYPQLAAVAALLFMAVLGFASIEEAVIRRRSNLPQSRLGQSACPVQPQVPLTAHLAGAPGVGGPTPARPGDELLVVEVVTIYTR